MSYYSNGKDMKEKSLYNLYYNYDKLVIDAVLNTFSKEYKNIGLLKAKYGVNYDGINAKGIFNYLDEQRLQSFLMRIELRLKCYDTLIKQGKNIEEINAMFEDKNEIEAARIVGDVLGTGKKIVKQEEIFKDVEDILEKYKISMDELTNAISNISDMNKRLCYIYTYGINRKKMNITSICKMLNIDNKTYHKYIMEIQMKLPDLLMSETKITIQNEEVKPIVKKNKPNLIKKEKIKHNIKEEIDKIKETAVPNDLHKIDIYKLIPNAYLIMDNPISNNDFVNIPNIEEIIVLYNEIKDSNKMLELLNIDKNKLISIYIENIELFTDIPEIISYIALNADINTIMLLISRIFNNEITVMEKELIYLKLLQLQNDKITNDIISLITGLSIQDINDYRIMTNNDKINTLNKLL